MYPHTTTWLGCYPADPLSLFLCQQVRHAFIEYSEYMQHEVNRVRANIHKLQPSQNEKLCPEFWALHERYVFTHVLL